jgi:NDP-sugar pyrophosphorylase family protein
MMSAGPRSLRAGVIAAGRGDRLKAGMNCLKPLVRISGRTLIERVLESIGAAGATEVVVIVNEASVAVRDHVSALEWPFPIRWIVETTPSSMHSFLRVLEGLAENGDQGPFLISTVDTVAAPGAFADFVDRARHHPEADVTLALTAPGEDEKPLLVRLEGSRVAAMGRAVPASPYATAGYYLVRPSILREAAQARLLGLGALRAYFSRLLELGYRIEGIPAGESMDVDRPNDVAAAEEFLRRTI